MRKNIYGHTYWTGLSAGEEHERVCREGVDYIVCRRTGRDAVGIPEHVLANTQQYLDAFDPDEWFRIRAMSLVEAEARLGDCYDQWYFHENSPDATEEEVLNVVLKPVGERDECKA